MRDAWAGTAAKRAALCCPPFSGGNRVPGLIGARVLYCLSPWPTMALPLLGPSSVPCAGRGRMAKAGPPSRHPTPKKNFGTCPSARSRSSYP
jgi:hypothetical protein